jgi:hypothetical protein
MKFQVRPEGLTCQQSYNAGNGSSITSCIGKVSLEKDSYQGIASAMPSQAKIFNGFSLGKNHRGAAV